MSNFIDLYLQLCVGQNTIGAENRGEMEELLAKIPAASVRG